MAHIFVETLMIDTDSEEKCSNSYDKPYSCKCKCIEKLIVKSLIHGIYIPAPSEKKNRLDSKSDPENPPMDTIDEDKDKNIDQRKVEHRSSIGEEKGKSKESFCFFVIP